MKGYYFTDTKCRVMKESTGRENEALRCDVCNKAKKHKEKKIMQKHKPNIEESGRRSRIDYIANDPVKADHEIRRLRATIDILKKQKSIEMFEEELEKYGLKIRGQKVERVAEAVEEMSPIIEKELAGDQEALELWQLQRERLNQVHEKGLNANGKRKRGRAVSVHPVILNWAISFLARTSATVYKEVQRVMLLPDIREVQRATAKMVSGNADMALGMCIKTIRELKKRADNEGWTKHQRRGCIGLDSANINAGVQHDINTNKIVGLDESHRLGCLSQMFHTIADNVKRAKEHIDIDNQDQDGTTDGDNTVALASSDDKKVNIVLVY